MKNDVVHGILCRSKLISLLQRLVVVGASFSLLACGGGGGLPQQPAPSQPEMSSQADTSSSVAGVTSSSMPPVTSVQLQGRVTFDWVAPSISGNSVFLDYGKQQVRPARAVTVQLLDSLNNPISSTRTDSDGQYQFNVEANRQVKVRVKAALDANNYAIAVKDNTRSGAEYVLDGSLAASGTNEVQTRDLHARLGWNGTTYTGERQSAPFAILDAVYESLMMVLDADPSISLPPLTVYWSVNNIASSGSFDEGDIGSSLYSTGATAIYVLGHADNDTDEFDKSVIQHEFGHYIEDKLSRSESIGGSHQLGLPLDMRVAFGEGFGNAFASMSSGSPYYLDTYGQSQSNGFGFNVETNRYSLGYYSEAAVQTVLFDVFDDATESGDSLALGFAPILQTLRHDDYLRFDGYSSIFSFAAVLKTVSPISSAGIDELLEGQGIFGTDAYGTGESATGGAGFTLPVYQRISQGEVVEVCSDNKFEHFNSTIEGEYNSHVNRRFVLLDVAITANYTITATRSAGLSPSDPDLTLYREGTWAGFSEAFVLNTESWGKRLSAGTYVLSVYEAANVDDNSDTGGFVCFDVSFN